MFKGWEDPKKNPFLVQTIVQSIKYIHFWNIFTSFVLVSLRDIWGISMNMISGSRRVSPQIRNPITIDRPQPISQITHQTQTNSHDTQGKDIVPMHLMYIVQFKLPEIVMWFFIGKTHTNLMDRPFNRQLTFALPYWITAVRLCVYLDFVKSIEQELKIQWEYRLHRNFDFKRRYLGNGAKFWKIEENKVQLWF